MKSVNDILLLGDSRLYEICEPVKKEEFSKFSNWINDLHDVLLEVKTKLGYGRGIAASQLGIMKRLIYIHIDRPFVLINPEIVSHSDKTFEVWDDCMSIPNLLVKVKRFKNIDIKYWDVNWNERTLKVSDPNLSELLQHEIDHLNGILCTMRAIDGKSFKYRRPL